MFIYQIGNVVIKGILEHSTPLSWRGEAVQTSQQSKVKFTNFYTLPNVTQARLTGSLYAQQGLTVVDQHRRLAMMGGVPYVDVIGYTPNSLCHKGCVDWWYTYGMITSMPRPFTAPDSLDVLELDLEVALNPQWVPLAHFMWGAYYGNDEIHAGEYEIDVDDIIEDMLDGYRINSFPCEVTPWQHEDGFRFLKANTTDNLSDFPFGLSSGGNPYNLSWDFPEKGYFDAWLPTLRWNLDVIPNPYEFVVQNAYGGDIDTLYVFRTQSVVPLTGTLEIIVQSELSPGNIITHTSVLDLAQFEDDITTAEYGAADGGGLYIICSNNDIAPSYVSSDGSYANVIRSSITGELFRPDWTYEYRCPGELIGYRNEVSVELPAVGTTLTAARASTRHLYRTV